MIILSALLHPIRVWRIAARTMLGLPMFPDTRRGRRHAARYERNLEKRMRRADAKAEEAEIKAFERDIVCVDVDHGGEASWEMEIEDE